MNQQIMFGVVLWSDAAARKAVIWCEDQGELAYYTPAEGNLHEGPVLDAGDLIQFDLSVQQNIRKASNPQLVVQSHSPNLPEKLREGQGKGAHRGKPVNAEKSPNVVVLSQYFAAPEQRKLVCTG
ncbi:hypothetical protein [Marivita sp.]|uniref:hypothetical protein n=1 Tax=Marivita sp. TaxID=2003365 RepID=UPI0025B9CC20|nr:hypothetical protein [Marivita sp.]